MKAIIKTGGKQYKVSAGDKIFIEKINNNIGEKITFDDILMLSDEEQTILDSSVLNSAKVDAKIVNQTKGKKIEIVKFKRRKHYRRRAGHRQKYTMVEITDVRSSQSGA